MGPLLVVIFLLVPIVEIYVIIQVGQVIGPMPTIALLIIESLIGAWLLKREGSATWMALQEAAASGRLPGRELADAGLVLVGGVLLLTPGFVTDVVGFFFILPPTRPLARRLLAWLVARRATRAAARVQWTGRTSAGPPGRAGPTGRPPVVLDGELVTDTDTDGTGRGPDRGGTGDEGPDSDAPKRQGP